MLNKKLCHIRVAPRGVKLPVTGDEKHFEGYFYLLCDEWTIGDSGESAMR